jgi:hypothetical protein
MNLSDYKELEIGKIYTVLFRGGDEGWDKCGVFYFVREDQTKYITNYPLVIYLDDRLKVGTINKGYNSDRYVTVWMHEQYQVFEKSLFISRMVGNGT